jgi:hypothetical protein
MGFPLIVYALSIFSAFLDASQSTMSSEDIKKVIEQYDIRSIEDLLPQLPPAYTRHFVLANGNRGLQQSSKMHPRVLMFGEDSKSVFTFNGSATQRGYFSFEMMEFNETTQSFEYRVVQFSEDRAKPVFSEKNPARCLTCHGANPRPIYGDYQHWAGFYQDIDSDPEYGKFVSSMESHPRYRHLQKTYLPPVGGKENESALGQPLNFYGKLLVRVMAYHVANEFKKSVDYEKLRYGYLTEFADVALECENWNADPTLPKRFEEKIARAIRARYSQKKFYKENGMEEWLANGSLSSTVLPSLAFDFHGTIADFEKPSALPLLEFLNFDGNDYLREHVAMLMAHDERKLLSEVGKWLQPDPGRMERYYENRYKGLPSVLLDNSLTWVTFGPNKAEGCQALRQKAGQELGI